jgi:hypothetical protein
MSRDETQVEGPRTDEWRPQSLRPAEPVWPSPRVRTGVLAAVVLGHVAVALWLPWLDSSAPAAPEAILVLDFTELPPLSEPPPLPVREPARPTSQAPEATRAPRKRTHPVASQALQVQQVQRPPPPDRLELYGEDGRLKLPSDMLERIDRKFGDTRTFDYQIPGMERADKLLHRPAAITFERTRFDEYWEPDQDLLTSLLAKMVEKTTKEIRVPVPGRSGSTMVCKVSLLALGGGCGVLTPGSDYVGPVDDPDTLSPEEDRQCQAWWEQIVGATTQDVWRKTRKLYEAQCRKPLERVPAG